MANVCGLTVWKEIIAGTAENSSDSGRIRNQIGVSQRAGKVRKGGRYLDRVLRHVAVKGAGGVAKKEIEPKESFVVFVRREKLLCFLGFLQQTHPSRKGREESRKWKRVMMFEDVREVASYTHKLVSDRRKDNKGQIGTVDNLEMIN